MKLVTLGGARGTRPGAVVDDAVVDLAAAVLLDLAPPDWPPRSLRALLAGGDPALGVARALVARVEDAPESTRERLRAAGCLLPLAEAPLLAPIPHPRLILCGGNNYASHSREMNVPVPAQPSGFVRAQSCITGPGAPVVLPRTYPDMVDYEGEFTFVVGRPAHGVSEAEALDYVAGYLCANDISARDWAAAYIKVLRGKPVARGPNGEDPRTMNTLLKQFPTFMPTGPWIVTADEMPDPHRLQLRTLVNGEVRQDANTADLVFDVPRTLAFWSRFYQLQPGDLITTGSPPGVGYGRKPPVFLRPGDEVTVEVAGVGRLTNPIVAAD